MGHNFAKLTVLILASMVSGWAQEFEMASVKPSPWFDGVCPQSIKVDRGRVNIECATLRTLIGYAFRFSPERVKGPDWMMDANRTRFHIAAKIPQGTPSDRAPEMLQVLLASRFKLTIHRAATRQEVYALVVSKDGIKIQSAGAAAGVAELEAPAGALDFFGEVQTGSVPNPDGGGSTTTIRNPRMGTVLETEGRNRAQQWHAPSISSAGLADLLDKVAPLPLPIIDMTGLKGRYQLVLEVRPVPLRERGAPEDMEAGILNSFNEGLRTLGLQLERRTAAVESVMVDHVEKMPSEN